MEQWKTQLYMGNNTDCLCLDIFGYYKENLQACAP